MRHCEPPSWDLTLLRAEEILFQERVQPWVLLDTPEWRVPGLHQQEGCTLGFIWLVQISRACRSASLQAGEPPFMIKAEKLSLLEPNPSLSKADV